MQCIVLPLKNTPGECFRQKKAPHFCGALCWHYLSSRQVTLQVLSAQMSLTSVFGMGTGGPSSQSIPTRMDGFPHRLCQNPRSGFNCFCLTPHSFPNSRNITLAWYSLCIMCEELVTRTGFEPMLKAWEASVLTTWPTGHWCTFTDSNRGPTD